VVNLEHEGDLALGQALDHRELPQRTPSIERLRGDVGHQLGENPFRSGSRSLQPAEVVADVEGRIIDPDRKVETKRHCHEPAPEGSQAGRSFLHQAEHAFVGVAAARA
jgi:hypothetical protein